MMGKGKSKTNVPALSEAAQAVFDPAINEYKKQQGGIFSARKAFGAGGAGPGSKFAQSKFNNLNNPNPAQPPLTMAEILTNAQQDYQNQQAAQDYQNQQVAQAPSTPGFDPANPQQNSGLLGGLGLSALINFLQAAGPGANQGAPSLGPMGSMGSAVLGGIPGLNGLNQNTPEY